MGIGYNRTFCGFSCRQHLLLTCSHIPLGILYCPLTLMQLLNFILNRSNPNFLLLDKPLWIVFSFRFIHICLIFSVFMPAHPLERSFRWRWSWQKSLPWRWRCRCWLSVPWCPCRRWSCLGCSAHSTSPRMDPLEAEINKRRKHKLC